MKFLKLHQEKIMKLHYFILFYVAATILSSLSHFAQSENDGFSIELIHPDSPKSPFYNPALNQRQLMKNALKRSINRANYLLSNSQLSTLIIPDIKGLYLTKISIGTKPRNKLAVVDTGSDLIWIQCEPCIHCYKQKTPIFNPKDSSTYKSISCNSTRCKNLPGSSCDPKKKTCLYFAGYNDQSFSSGVLVSETFTFDDATNITRRRRLSVSNITFGCGRRNFLAIGDVEPTGIIGLGASPFSLVSQIKSKFGHRFSHCLVPLNQVNVSSRLNFGKKALLSSGKHVVSTPLFIKPPKAYYFLKLLGITIGNKTLRFNNNSTKNLHEGNIAIDSGTTITFLPTHLYSKMKKTIKSEINLKPLKGSATQFFKLCYRGLRVSDVPLIRFQFQDAEVKLNAINSFISIGDGVVCLAFAPTKNLPIFGNVAQTNFFVAYDLDKMKVSFKPKNCAKL
ncbi:aspartic proteinase CDR1-like [Lycium barbarum]|uniref:aspartic proteinase CDR1-like n=1 Tax=Lycium barbarum TaxID=112863 RepID=UPI00293E623E|nr:aspartic proteinase CDR1-like [Lycium barbarum]